jgi:hypothetical protein
MKRFLSLLLMVTLPWLVFAQANEIYNIIKVDGEIVNKSNGKLLAPGDKIKPSDQLEFKNSYATAVVISNARGKFTLRPAEQADAFGDTKLLAMAGNAVSPISSRAQISTRAIGPPDVKDLSKYFGNQDFYLIGEKLSVKLNKTVYPLGPSCDIIFSFQGKNEKISKKIPYSGQSINIAREQLVSSADDLDKGTTLKQVGVLKFDNSSNQSSLITTVNLVFLNIENIKKEFAVILPILKEQNMQRFEAVDYLKGYFNDVYGPSDPDVLYLVINMEVGKVYQ